MVRGYMYDLMVQVVFALPCSFAICLSALAAMGK